MAGKITADAYAYYVGLGPDRSFQAVAEKYGVTRRAVAKRAAKEKWKDQVAELDARAKDAVERRAVESLEQMNDRHLKMLRVIQSKALEALKAMPLDTAYQATRALVAAIGQERVARGEPSERTAVEIESVIRKEYEACLLPPGEQEDWNFHEDGR